MGESSLLCWAGFWMHTRRKSHAGMCRRLPQRGCLAELAAKRNEGVGTSVGMNARGFITAKYESKKKNDMEEDKWGGTSH